MHLRTLHRLLADEEAATAVEYCLFAALISLACVIALQMLGLDLANVFVTATKAMAGK